MRNSKNSTGTLSLNSFLGAELTLLDYLSLLGALVLLLPVACVLFLMLLISTTARQCLSLRVDALVDSLIELSPRK